MDKLAIVVVAVFWFNRFERQKTWSNLLAHWSRFLWFCFLHSFVTFHFSLSLCSIQRAYKLTQINTDAINIAIFFIETAVYVPLQVKSYDNDLPLHYSYSSIYFICMYFVLVLTMNWIQMQFANRQSQFWMLLNFFFLRFHSACAWRCLLLRVHYIML